MNYNQFEHKDSIRLSMNLVFSQLSNKFLRVCKYLSRRLILQRSVGGTGVGLDRMLLNLYSGQVFKLSLVSRKILSRFDPVLVFAFAPIIRAKTATSLLGLLSKDR